MVGAGTGARAEIIAHEETLNRMSAPAGVAGADAGGGVADVDVLGHAQGVLLQRRGRADRARAVGAHRRRQRRRSSGARTSLPPATCTRPSAIRSSTSQRGGSISGVLDGLNQLLELVIAGEKTEGGTMIVPGHGRISDEADLVEYRDMVTIIRDRVQDMVNRGMTLAQVQAAQSDDGVRRPVRRRTRLVGLRSSWKPSFVA